MFERWQGGDGDRAGPRHGKSTSAGDEAR